MNERKINRNRFRENTPVVINKEKGGGRGECMERIRGGTNCYMQNE